MRICCPKCGTTADFEAPSIGTANDNLVSVDELPKDIPQGFRVVVFGWNSPYEYLCCSECGAPAERV